jgi:hypothetical protein
VPDTGQTKCYDDAGNEISPCPSSGEKFYGQDANYTINPMSYTKLDANGNALQDSATAWSMVKDNVTGLIWEMKTNKDEVKNYNDPHDADNTYTWYDSNPATNGGDAGVPGDGTDTEDFIKALNDAHYGGYSNWRLPTINELRYIFDNSILNLGPTINAAYFPNTVASFYSSSTTFASSASFAWGMPFTYGVYDGGYSKGSHNYVRAVRGEQSGSLGDSVIELFDTLDSKDPIEMASSGNYTDNGDGTVTDVFTGLMWQQDPSTSSWSVTWEEALAYCEGLKNLGGYSDWRLPTINELRSLADYSRYSPAINTTYFPTSTVLPYCWSSTTCADSTNYAWGVSFHLGADIIYGKGLRISVRAVRGGQSGSLGKLAVSPSTRSVTKDVGTTTFTVSNAGTGTMTWTAEASAVGEWLRIKSGSSGTNAGTITCEYDANTGTESRTGTIVVTATGAAGSPKEVTVTQAPGQVDQMTVKFWGIWPDGVWIWDQPTRKWTNIPSTSGAQMIAAGKVDNDQIDDLIGVWSSGLYVHQSTNGQWVTLSTNLPAWIIAGDLNTDGRDEVIGSWNGNGVYYWDTVTGQWIKISSSAKQLATGNVGGKSLDDLVGVYSDDGLWVRYSTDGSWIKIDAAIPLWTTTADMTGSGRADIVGSYSTGTWYRDSATGAWKKITIPASQLTSGDIDNDGRDDLIGIWSDGVWVRYGATGQWQKITSSKPTWITTGKTANAAPSKASVNEFGKTGEIVSDLSATGPSGQNAEIVVLDDTGPERME